MWIGDWGHSLFPFAVDSDGDGSGSAVVTRFTYEDGNAWGDLNTSGSLTSRRIFGQGLDDLIARIGSSGNEDWYLHDIIGSTRDIVDYTGILIDRLAYDAYGLVTTETSPSNGDRYKFTSREWEAEIELQYNRARYLDPKAMRWISEDPIGFDAGDSNLYRYVSNNPVVSVDLTGLKEQARGLQEAEMCMIAVFHRPLFRLTTPELREILLQTTFQPRKGILEDPLSNIILENADAWTYRDDKTGSSLIYFNKIPTAFDGSKVKSIAQAALIGHEMVHVIQYKRLGAQRFIGEYMRSYNRNRAQNMAKADAYKNVHFERVAFTFEKALAEVLKTHKGKFEQLCENHLLAFTRWSLGSRIQFKGKPAPTNADIEKGLSSILSGIDKDPNFKVLNTAFETEWEKAVRVEFANELMFVKNIQDIGSVLWPAVKKLMPMFP